VFYKLIAYSNLIIVFNVSVSYEFEQILTLDMHLHHTEIMVYKHQYHPKNVKNIYIYIYN